MTHEELLEKRRVGFEEWVISDKKSRMLRDLTRNVEGGYRSACENSAWHAWNAALDSVEIELPAKVSQDLEEMHWHQVRNNTIDSCRLAIQQQGYKVKK